MWILASCVILNAFIGVIFKLFDRFKIDNFQAIVVNYLVCVLTAAAVKGDNPIPDQVWSLPWFWYALGLGSIFIIVFNLMALTVQNFGIVIATIFQKMSLIAPTLIAILFYNESSGILKWLGILASLMAIIILGHQKTDKKLNTEVKSIMWLFPIATFLGSCIIDSALFLVEQNDFVTNGDLGFISSLFLSAGINGLLILIYLIMQKKTVLKWKNLVAGIGLGIPNFFSIYLLLLALQQGWGGSVVFPVNNIGVLVFAAIFGLVIFKEKLTPIKVIGFILAILSIFLITMS